MKSLIPFPGNKGKKNYFNFALVVAKEFSFRPILLLLSFFFTIFLLIRIFVSYKFRSLVLRNSPPVRSKSAQFLAFLPETLLFRRTPRDFSPATPTGFPRSFRSCDTHVTCSFARTVGWMSAQCIRRSRALSIFMTFLLTRRAPPRLLFHFGNRNARKRVDGARRGLSLVTLRSPLFSIAANPRSTPLTTSLSSRCIIGINSARGPGKDDALPKRNIVSFRTYDLSIR